MVLFPLRKIAALALLFLCFAGSLPAAESFRIATYNVENYLLEPSGTRPAKSAAAKAKVCESILALKPDVLALQEIGGTNALFELQSSLKTNGLDLPNWELITGFDTNIHVAILSRFPIIARQPHTNESFLMAGQRFRVSRGFAEVEIKVNDRYAFTLIAAHLKSRRPIPEADEADLRLEEAQVLRQIIDGILAARPEGNLVVLGDLNDVHSSKPVKTILGGRGKKGLVDTRPAERNGDAPPSSDRRLSSRNITWTHYYNVDDDYSRIDYILLSKGMAKEWISAETYVLSAPNWGIGSDHRPLVATFLGEDR
jgi:endonuclease/exonuclease/phosphatase family metal-dependent hydrolase